MLTLFAHTAHPRLDGLLPHFHLVRSEYAIVVVGRSGRGRIARRYRSDEHGRDEGFDRLRGFDGGGGDGELRQGSGGTRRGMRWAGITGQRRE